METKDIKEPSDWQPMKGGRVVAAIGKLGEEASELSSAIFRCIIQGISECEPTTGKSNRQWLLEEFADVHALLALVQTELHMTPDEEKAVAARFLRKLEMKRKWMEMVK